MDLGGRRRRVAVFVVFGEWRGWLYRKILLGSEGNQSAGMLELLQQLLTIYILWLLRIAHM